MKNISNDRKLIACERRRCVSKEKTSTHGVIINGTIKYRRNQIFLIVELYAIQFNLICRLNDQHWIPNSLPWTNFSDKQTDKWVRNKSPLEEAAPERLSWIIIIFCHLPKGDQIAQKLTWPMDKRFNYTPHTLTMVSSAPVKLSITALVHLPLSLLHCSLSNLITTFSVQNHQSPPSLSTLFPINSSSVSLVSLAPHLSNNNNNRATRQVRSNYYYLPIV